MAKGVRFSKAAREWMRQQAATIVGAPTGIPKSTLRVAQEIVEKLDASEALQVKVRSGVLVRDAITAFRSVLDRRLIAPPQGANGLFAMMQNRLNALGLTYEQCVTIAQQANTEWRSGNIKVESLIRQAETLLAHADGQSSEPRGRESAAPVEMDEW